MILIHYVAYLIHDKTLIDLQEELDVLRTKFEKMDKERQELRQQNEKLESRVRPKILIAI